MRKLTPKRMATFAVTAVLALVLAGCSSSSEDANKDHNDQDVTFAQNMIPHHAQAIEMAQLASTRALKPEVKQLATQIQAAQQPEIDTLNGWLRSWGESEVSGNGSSMGGMAGMDHGSSGGMGMMSDDVMNRLESLNGAEFDRLFLQSMIEHHTGAIEMAKTQQEKGKYEPAKTMASNIIATQQAEIDEMNRLFG